MTVNIARKLVVDRIAIKLVLGAPEYVQFIREAMESMEEMESTLLPSGRIILRKNQYQWRLDYYPQYIWKKAGRRKIVDLILGAYKAPGKKAIDHYLRLTLYPSQFRGEEFQHFKHTLDLLFDMFTYDMFYMVGMVTYLELAWDTLSHKNHEFLPYRKWCTKSEIQVEDTGFHGTLYVGSKSSSLWFRVYDKVKQLKDTGKSTKVEILPCTRIEAVLQSLGRTPAKLLEIDENPFKRLQIADLQQVKAIELGDDWKAFIAESLHVGVPRALKERPDKVRSKYLSMLDDCQVKWWKPDWVWKQLPGAVAILMP